MMKMIRIVLGWFVLVVEKLFAPKKKKHSAKESARLASALSGLSVYEFRTCPYCMKLRWAMRRLGINLPLKDAQGNPQNRRELLEQGGKIQVPCLRIESKDGSVKWMYESNDIISYLNSVCSETKLD